MSDIKRTAAISECGKYRYMLGRDFGAAPSGLDMAKIWWRPKKQLVFVMLNPSTADAYEDDPTIRRCIGFGKRDEYDEVLVMNLFAGRATKPADLFKMDDPVGPENENYWKLLKASEATIILAWGADKRATGQARKFLNFMAERELHCLGVTANGSPRHPLYLKADSPLQVFQTGCIPQNARGGV